MLTTEDYETQETALGDRIYDEFNTKEAIEASKKSFELHIVKTVKNGGKLEVEEFTTSTGVAVQKFKLRVDALNSLSISKHDAIKFCGHNS